MEELVQKASQDVQNELVDANPEYEKLLPFNFQYSDRVGQLAAEYRRSS